MNSFSLSYRTRIQTTFNVLLNNSLLRNSLFIMATTLSTAGLGYVYWIIAARIYSPAAIGLASALISAMSITANVTNLGLGSTLIQMLPNQKTDREWSLTVNAAFLGATVVSVCGAGGITLFLPVIAPQFASLTTSPLYAMTFIGGVALWMAVTLLDAIYTAERVAGNMLVRNIAFAVLKIVLLLALIPLTVSSFGIFASWVIATALSLGLGIVLVLRLKRHYSFSFTGVGTYMRTMARSLVGHHFINIGGSAPMYILPILVTIRLTPADNAYFYSTWMIGSLFFIISPAVSTALFAEGSHVPTNLNQKLRFSGLIISSLLLPMIIFFLLAGRYILTVFGDGYATHGGTLFLILTVAAIPDAITNIYISVLRVHKRLSEAAYLNVGMASVALVLAWFLLPDFGITGAGIAWFSAQALGTLYVGYRLLCVRQRTGLT